MSNLGSSLVRTLRRACNNLFLVEVECRIFGPGGYSSKNYTVEMNGDFWTIVFHCSLLGAGSFLSIVLVLSLGLFLWSLCHTIEHNLDEKDAN